MTTQTPTDTGIRYPNRRGAEVQVTKLPKPEYWSDTADGDFENHAYGWRCAGCQDSGYESGTHLREARTQAERHADRCKALPPYPHTTKDPGTIGEMGSPTGAAGEKEGDTR